MLTTLGISSRLHHCPGLETGQTTVYVTGDNGTYQTGRSKEYAVLTTGQYSGTTAIVLNGKTDNHSNNCVQDLRTMKMWSRYVSAALLGPASDGRLPFTTNGSGEGIFPYADAANTANLAGWADWRPANRKDLEDLIDDEAPDSSPDSTAFPGFPVGVLFSSTTRANLTTYAHTYGTLTGYIYPVIKTDTNYVLLVRGGYGV